MRGIRCCREGGMRDVRHCHEGGMRGIRHCHEMRVLDVVMRTEGGV